MAYSAPHAPPPTSRSSRISLAAALLCVGFTPLLMVPCIDEYTLLPRLLLLQLATLLAAVAWACRKGALGVPGSPLHLPAVVLFAILAASVLWALNPFRATYDLSKYLTFLLFFIVVVHNLGRTHIPAILGVSAAAGAVVSLLGIGEYLGFLPEWIPSTGRPSSTFGFRNLAASYLVANLPLSALCFSTSRRLRGRLLGGLSTALMLVFLLYTRGRGAWVGLFAASLLSLGLWGIVAGKTLWHSLKHTLDRPALIVAAGALTLVALLGPLSEGFKEHHIQRFDEKKADISSAVSSILKRGGDRGRFTMWRNTLKMIRDAPFLGVGVGNWEYTYPLYDRGQTIEPKFSPLRPHNDLLWIWSEEGTLGLVAYVTLLGAFLVLAVRIWRRNPDPRVRLTALACCITVFAVVGDGCFGFSRERIPPSLLFWLGLALVGVLSRETGESPASFHTPQRHARLAALLIPLLLLAGICITIRHIGFDYYYIRATFAFLKNDQPALARQAGRAIALGPYNHQAFNMRGQALLAQKDYGLAERAFRRGLTYHPNFANTYNNLGLLYDELGRTDEALFAYHKALDIVPNHYTTWHNLGLLHQKKGRLDSAAVCYRRAFSQNHTKPYVNLGSIYRKLGLVDSAIVVYRAALAGSPPAVEAHYNLGNIYADRHEYEKAVEAYGDFLSATGGNPEYVQIARKGLGEAYSGLAVQAEQRGELDRAVEMNRTALQHWPESPQVWFNLGNALRKEALAGTDSGNDAQKKEAWNRAIHAYTQAIGRDSAFVSAYNNLGMTYHDLGQHKKAIAVYRKALQIRPDEPILHYNMGNTYADLGYAPGALAAYSGFLKHWKGAPSAATAVRSTMAELGAPAAQRGPASAPKSARSEAPGGTDQE